MANLLPQYPTGLNDIFMSPNTFLAQQGVEQFNTAQETAKLNQQMGLQDYLFNEKNNPLKLDQQRLANETTLAQLPGHQADSQIKQRNAQVRNGVPLDEEIKSKRAELAKSVSDSELTQVENAVKVGLVDPSPQVRQTAQAMWEHLAEIKKLKLDHANKVELATIGANARVAAAPAPKAAPIPKDPKGLMTYYAMLKNQYPPDSQEYKELEAKENAEWEKVQEMIRKQAEAGRVGKPDLSRLPGGGIPTTQSPPLVPVPSRAQGAPAPQQPPQSKYVAGQVYQGATGKFKFNGGDPADKNNWAEVKD